MENIPFSKCDSCTHLVMKSYEECDVFGGDVLSMSGNGINFENCQRYTLKQK